MLITPSEETMLLSRARGFPSRLLNGSKRESFLDPHVRDDNRRRQTTENPAGPTAWDERTNKEVLLLIMLVAFHQAANKPRSGMFCLPAGSIKLGRVVMLRDHRRYPPLKYGVAP